MSELTIKSPKLIIKAKGTQGPPGRVTFAVSAYQEWLDAGYEGTPDDFLAFLIGPQGPQGEPGINGTNGTDGTNGTNGVDGADGADGSSEATAITIVDIDNYYDGDTVEEVLTEIGDTLNTLSRTSFRAVVDLTSSVDAIADHENCLLMVNSESPVSYTVRTNATNAIRTLTTITLCQEGTGKVTLVAESGVTFIFGDSFNAATMEQGALIVLVKIRTNTWLVGGALEAVE